MQDKGYVVLGFDECGPLKAPLENVIKCSTMTK